MRFTVVVLVLLSSTVCFAADISEPLLWSVKVDGLWGFIDASGTIRIEPRFENAISFSEGLSAVREKGKWGYINLKGDYQIPPKYKNARFFSEGYARVTLGKESFFINKKGEGVSRESVTSYSSYLKEGLAIYHNSKRKVGYINSSGKIVIEPKYDDGYLFCEGLACVELGRKLGEPYYVTGRHPEKVIKRTTVIPGKWGFIDKEGDMVIPAIYEKAEVFHEGLACVMQEGKWGFINKQGEIVIPTKYKKSSFFSDGLASIPLDGKLQYIDKQGRTVVEGKYASGRHFSGGLAAVKNVVSGKWGYINKSGELVIGFLFDRAFESRNGLWIVWIDDKMGYINAKGDFVWKPSK